MTAVVLPPSGSFQMSKVVADGGALLSMTIQTSDPITLTQDSIPPPDAAGPQSVPKTASLIVLGDVVTICGPVSLPGQNVTIFCRQLKTRIDSQGRPASISVNGDPGTDASPLAVARAVDGLNGVGTGAAGWSADQHPEMHGRKGNSGTPGKNAGRILLVCGSIDPDTALALNAVGGRGGNGSQGQSGGKGGDGAKGQDASLKYNEVEALGKHWAGYELLNRPTPGGTGGNGGNAGDGGDAGRGGAGGSIDCFVLNPAVNGTDADVGRWSGGNFFGFDLFAAVGKPGAIHSNVGSGPDGGVGAPGEPGAAGHGGAGGAGGRVTSPFDSTVWDFCHQAASGSWGHAGNPGAGGVLIPTEPPKQPPRAECTLRPDMTSIASIAPAITSPAYFKMQFKQACMHYLTAGDGERQEELTKGQDLLGWLQDMLDAFAPANPSLAPLRKSIGALLLNTYSGRNYFGERRTAVPRCSVEFLGKAVTSALARLKELEQDASIHAAGAAAQQEAHDHLAVALAQANARAGDWQARIADAQAQQADLLQQIESLTPEIAAAQKALSDSASNFKQAIQDATNGLTDEDLFGCMEQLSFADPESPSGGLMIGAQVGRILDKSQNYVTDGAGDNYKKEYVIHNIQLVGRDTGDLARSWKAVKPDGTIADDPRRQTRLLMARDSFERVCDAFYQKVEDASKACEAMEALVDLVQHRGELIDQYNACIGTIADMNSRLESAKGEVSPLQAALASNGTPDEPTLAAFKADLYDHAKAHCLQTLYHTSRALEYASLTPTPLFSGVLQDKHPNDLDYITLSAAWDSLNERLEAAVESAGADPQTFPADQTTGIPVRLSTVAPAALARLRSHGACTFTLRPKRNDPSDLNNFSGFADVRLTRVRVWLDDPKADAAAGAQPVLVCAVLTHKGEEWFTRPNGGTMTSFTHAAVSRNFRYYLGKDRRSALSGSGAQDGTLSSSTSTKMYAEIGPFARWRLELPHDLNPHLDLSSIQDVTLEFAGRNRPA